MYGGPEEELRAAEMAGRVFDSLFTVTPSEMHGIRQVHTSHIGGASLERENEAAYGSHDTSTPSARQQDTTSPVTRGGHVNSGVNSLVEIARRESVLRQLYSDKLRGSISAVFSALVNELPRDHIFLQLLNDETTHQYCKVRVGEVIEGFLFSVQAHQYHNLASELSKREVEVLALRGELEALEQRLHGPTPLRSFKTTQTDNRTDCGMNTAEPTAAVAPDSELAQPDELIALLEEVTREHELAKCRECLSAPTSLLATVQAEKEYGDKYEYLADIVAHLFRSVQGLVSYAEGSLDSLESLRHGLSDVCDDDSSAPVHRVRVAPRASPFEEERSRLESVAGQMKLAQKHCADLISALSRIASDLHQERDEAKESARRAQLQFTERSSGTQEMSHAMKASEAALVELRGDVQRLLVVEREAAERDARHAANEQRAAEALSAARAECALETQRAQGLEATSGELRRALSAAHARHFASLAEAARAGMEALTHKSQTAKLELLAACAYEPAAAVQLYKQQLAHEAVRHVEARAEVEARALRDHETSAQLCYDELRRLLSEMREDERHAEAERCAEEAESLSACEAQSATDSNALNDAHTHLSDEERKAAEARVTHGISATLTGVAAGLRAAYDTVRYRLRHLRSRNASLRARTERLGSETAQLKAELRRLWEERSAMGRQETLRGLLAQQEALVAAVSGERESLRARWSALSEDYQALERRNSQLHERCAAKEVENARLMGVIRTRNITSSAAQSPSEPNSCASAPRDESAAEGKAAMEKETPEARAPAQRAEAQRSDSSATAGLSAPARTSCSSTAGMDEAMRRE